MAQVTLRSLVKKFDRTEAVRGIDLDIADHEFVVLVGPSGCGKSTTLRMIAGLEDISDGDIMIGGDVVNDVPPKEAIPGMSGSSGADKIPVAATTNGALKVSPASVRTVHSAACSSNVIAMTLVPNWMSRRRSRRK